MASVEERLQTLWSLQTIDSRLDKLRAVRGELPLEVADLEDEITGLETRHQNFDQEIEDFSQKIVGLKEEIEEAKRLDKRYNDQLNKVKNNREFDALNKEIEIQGLVVLSSEKKIGETQKAIEFKNESISELDEKLKGRRVDLEAKKAELTEITEETEKEEEKVLKERDKAVKKMEEKLDKAYIKIRANVRNGIAVAPVVRGACGGCFAKIPPQLQSDIRQRKKLVICEHCGRINVDAKMAGIEEEIVEEKPKSRRRRKVAS
jgi:uncharacterized protein